MNGGVELYRNISQWKMFPAIVFTSPCNLEYKLLSDNWLRLMEIWYGLLVVIDFNHWKVIF